MSAGILALEEEPDDNVDFLPEASRPSGSSPYVLATAIRARKNFAHRCANGAWMACTSGRHRASAASGGAFVSKLAFTGLSVASRIIFTRKWSPERSAHHDVRRAVLFYEWFPAATIFASKKVVGNVFWVINSLGETFWRALCEHQGTRCTHQPTKTNQHGMVEWCTSGTFTTPRITTSELCVACSRLEHPHGESRKKVEYQVHKGHGTFARGHQQRPCFKIFNALTAGVRRK